MASNSDLVDWCDGRIGRWAYVFGGSRTDPDSTGGTDCSGMVCAAFADVFGVQPCELGDWTGAQWASDATSVVWWGTEYGRIPWDDMERGDIVFTSNCSPDFSTGNGSHVGFFTGTGDCGWEFCSMFGTPGPQYTRANGVYGNECYFGVKRYEPGLRAESEEDVSASDVWEYPIGQDATSGKGNVPAWQRLSWIHHDSAANYSALRGGYNGPAGTVQSGAPHETPVNAVVAPIAPTAL